MKRMRFTARELYILAETAGKEKMYGIPDDFAWESDENIHFLRQEVRDMMLEEGIFAMDFDGKLSVSADYIGLVEVYSCPEKCLTLNRQRPDGRFENMIFWLKDKLIYMAEAADGRYVFSETSPQAVEALILTDVWPGKTVQAKPGIVIPQIVLTKAKRFAKNGNAQEVLRILRQNGTDERTAAVLCDGLEEKAQYLRLLVIDRRCDKYGENELAFLSCRGITLKMEKEIVNFRTCTSFAEYEGNEARQQIRDAVDTFLCLE